MEYNYDFYIASSVVMAILMAYHFITPQIKSLANRIYSFLLVLTFGSCIFDVIWGEICIVYFADNMFLSYLFQMLTYSTQNLVPVTYLVYISILIENRDTFSKKMIYYCIPAVVVQLLVWTTPWTGLAFTYSYGMGYQRGPLLTAFV